MCVATHPAPAASALSDVRERSPADQASGTRPWPNPHDKGSGAPQGRPPAAGSPPPPATPSSRGSPTAASAAEHQLRRPQRPLRKGAAGTHACHSPASEGTSLSSRSLGPSPAPRAVTVAAAGALTVTGTERAERPQRGFAGKAVRQR